MFGDIGHGIILMLFGLWMVLYEVPLKAKKISSEVNILHSFVVP
jgi:V-type H+-transporting ATPase subunit a